MNKEIYDITDIMYEIKIMKSEIEDLSDEVEKLRGRLYRLEVFTKTPQIENFRQDDNYPHF